MSLAKAIGAAVGNVLLSLIGGVFMGGILAGLAVVLLPIPISLLGGWNDSSVAGPIVAVIGAAIFAFVLFVCAANGVIESLEAIKTRPRGLGIRMKRQPDGSSVEEKY